MASIVGKDKLAVVKAGLFVYSSACARSFWAFLELGIRLSARKTEALLLLVVLAEATKFSYEADTLRSIHEGLETQMKSLKARLAQTVSKSEFEAEVAVSTKLREQLHALQKTATDLEPIEGLLQVLAAPPSISVVHVTEFVLAVRSLQQDGLVETTELIKSMAGGVMPVASSDLEELVRALDGPPARHATDATRVLRAMGSRWKSDEVEVLLHECQGLAHIREILGANGDLESILAQEKAKRVAAQDEMKMLMESLAPIAPVFDPPGAKFTGSVTITISSDNGSDTIYCTADGSHPTVTHHQVHAHRLPPSMSVSHLPSTLGVYRCAYMHMCVTRVGCTRPKVHPPSRSHLQSRRCCEQSVSVRWALSVPSNLKTTW